MIRSEDNGAIEAQAQEECSDDVVEERYVDDMLYPTEAEKKKRRQERAWLEKEGIRCKKEGRPRNFLLVDEITQKPYGVGVEDWRKEVMLMSRDLDPAIGNINRQLEEVIAEIAEWIQHTWEYSSPIKYEYLKEVIARGVTLRQVELWKKIRNGEDKPNKMSDQTWRSLERQLDNPTWIRKSENCRKANAYRVNFGKKRPSGEVGVRHRLRRILRRSLDPEKRRYEMSRNKGFGARKPFTENNVNVMHGSQIPRRLIEGDRSVIGRGENVLHNKSDEEIDELAVENVVDNLKLKDTRSTGGEEEVVGEALLAMSAEKISEHPFVKMMMKRLEALEVKKNEKIAEDRQKVVDDVLNEEDDIEGIIGQQSSPKDKGDGGLEGEVNEASRMRTSGRLWKKAKRT